MLKTPVSLLQELTVQKRLPAPDYEIRGSGESHCMSFTSRVTTGGKTAEGKGSTKKDAKHDAARNMLKIFGLNMDNQNQTPLSCCLLLPSKPSKSDGPIINYVGKLNEFCSGHKHPQPTYVDSTTIMESWTFGMICIFNNYKTQGCGSTKKDAKQDSAKNMLALLKEKFRDNEIPVIPASPSDTLDEQYVDVDNNELSEQVIKKYTEMMKNISVNDNNNENDFKAVNKETNISTWEELIELLDKHGYNHELKTFQRYPLILSLKINDHVLMNSGVTKESICQKLVRDAVNMIRQGVNFAKPLLDV